jgi:hypothetical protein
MSDLPSSALYQQSHAKPHSGEFLEVLGKHAAADWGNGKYSTLTESVTETVKQAQLSPEQVKRVVEFANTSAFLTDFKKEGTTSKVVDFQGGPADASEILKDLNDGGGGSVFDRGMLDYESEPSSRKHASVKEEQLLHDLFGKTAAAELPYENPNAEVVDLKDKLAGAEQHLQSQLSGLEIAYADLADRVYHQVKQAALTGVSLGEIMQAWETVSPSPDHIKVAFTLITPRLLREGVFHGVESMTKSIDKTAGAKIVNTEHPIVVEFGEFCDVLSKLAETRSTRSEMLTQLQHLNAYLKQANAVGKAWDLAGGAGKALRPLGEAIGGSTGGAIASAAPKVMLAGGGLIAANEAKTHIENSPSIPARGVRAGARLVAQQIPGTEQNIRHKWEVQSGQ